MRPIIPPQVDMLTVSKSSNTQRKVLRKFAPEIGLTSVNYGRLFEIDSFYLDCQSFRDFYRDPYNRMHRPVSFEKHYGKCGLRRVDKTSEILLCPIRWVREYHPVVCPVPYNRKGLEYMEGINLGGYYDSNSCIRYKR